MRLDWGGEIHNFHQLIASVKKALRKLPKVKPLPARVLQQPEVQVVPINVNDRFLHVPKNAKAPTFRPGPCAAEAEPSGLMLALYHNVGFVVMLASKSFLRNH